MKVISRSSSFSLRQQGTYLLVLFVIRSQSEKRTTFGYFVVVRSMLYISIPPGTLWVLGFVTPARPLGRRATDVRHVFDHYKLLDFLTPKQHAAVGRLWRVEPVQ